MNSVQRDRLAIILALDYLFSETYCGGYSGEDPPLPIPNREVKLTIADGTAPPGGRVGSCHALTKSFETKVSELFFVCGSWVSTIVSQVFIKHASVTWSFMGVTRLLNNDTSSHSFRSVMLCDCQDRVCQVKSVR